jgi:hypothetical protein
VLVLQSPHDEAKDGRGGWIEPLNVVDRKQNRTASSQGAKAPQRAEGNRALIGDLIIPRLGANQCGSQRRTLHAGDLVEDFIDRGVEKVAERSERHGCLRGARSSLEHKPTSSGCAFHAGFPQGGFPDAGFTDQHEHARASRHFVQELGDDTQFRPPPEECQLGDAIHLECVLRRVSGARARPGSARLEVILYATLLVGAAGLEPPTFAS